MKRKTKLLRKRSKKRLNKKNVKIKKNSNKNAKSCRTKRSMNKNKKRRKEKFSSSKTEQKVHLKLWMHLQNSKENSKTKMLIELNMIIFSQK